MKIKKIYENDSYNKELYNELIRVNKEIITRWNIKIWLDKLEYLNLIDSTYNAYLFFEDNNIIWFWLILNEDWEDKNCCDIKDIFQLDDNYNYWLANFFIYPEFRWKWYWKKCFENLLSITKDKNFYLYTDKNNEIARKIYSKYMKEIWTFENKKIIYLRK